LKRLFSIFLTLKKLGVENVIFMAWYRFTLKSGLRRFRFKIRAFVPQGDFFLKTQKTVHFPEKWKDDLFVQANNLLEGKVLYFSFHLMKIGNPPEWFLNPFSEKEHPGYEKHWTRLHDFQTGAGDIKTIWEVNRFQWTGVLARAYKVSGSEKYLDLLNSWLSDWLKRNPLNQGPNWRCGQESSIRLLHLINTAYILQEHRSLTPAIMDFIYASLDRISKNNRYAISQNNNHGTSEAAGLYLGGRILEIQKSSRYPKASKYANKGRKLLEERIRNLVSDQGSFSQHSVNYHRVMLDTISFCEFWRKETSDSLFSTGFYRKANAAVNWACHLTDNYSSHAPNLGANDGSLLLSYHSLPYEDYSSSIHFASAVFNLDYRLKKDFESEADFWFRLKDNTPKRTDFNYFSVILDQEYVILRPRDSLSWAMVKIPNYNFRPSHNDVFHFDLWYKGENILIDAGTYSYNPGKNSIEKPLKSVKYHNTIEFDSKEQMPSISRFLLSNWIKPGYISPIISKDNMITWEGYYLDNSGNKHHRKIEHTDHEWIIEDELNGNFNQALIHYNLPGTNYSLRENIVSTDWGKLIVEGSSNIQLCKSGYSPHYLELRESTRICIQARKSSTCRTIIRFN